MREPLLLGPSSCLVPSSWLPGRLGRLLGRRLLWRWDWLGAVCGALGLAAELDRGAADLPEGLLRAVILRDDVGL